MRIFIVSRRVGHRARLAALTLAASLAGAEFMPAACAADTVVIVTASQSAVANLGAVPGAAPGRRVVVTGKLVGLEPPASGAVSIEVLLRRSTGAPPVSLGRFSPYPAVRINPQVPAQHQLFSVPATNALAAGSSGNWQVEFRMSTEGTPTGVQAQLFGVKFGTD